MVADCQIIPSQLAFFSDVMHHGNSLFACDVVDAKSYL